MAYLSELLGLTGKGLADLIRESLGVRATAIIMGIMVFANLANTVSLPASRRVWKSNAQFSF